MVAAASANAAVGLAQLLVLAGWLAGGTFGETQRTFSRILTAAAADDSLNIFSNRQCKSEADCAIICSTVPSCVKFRFQAALGLCQLSGMANANLGSSAWMDVEGASSIQSLCPMAVSGGRRFCVFQRRINSLVAFDMPWRFYEIGFGNAENWWIGQKLLHSLTQPRGKALHIELSFATGESYYYEYSGFRVSNSTDFYTMTYDQLLTESSSNGNDSLAHHRGMKFSTRDRDNDLVLDGACSESDGFAGWWYNSCFRCNPNGIYGAEIPANGSEAVGEEVGAAMWFAASDTQPMARVRLMVQV